MNNDVGSWIVHNHNKRMEELFPKLSPNGAKHKETSNFYTPDRIIKVARWLMGGIDLDPCSDAIGQSRVNATQFFNHGGLDRLWAGRVFVNPPGKTTIHTEDGSKQIARADDWWDKLYHHARTGDVTSGFYVSFSIDRLQTSQNGIHCAGILRYPTFIPSKRIAYLNADGSVAKSPPKPSCFTWVNEAATCELLNEAFRDAGIRGVAVRA